MRYYYKDFVTGKRRFTKGQFVGWQRGGFLGVIGATFVLRCSILFIPIYLLTKEAKAALPKEPDCDNDAMCEDCNTCQEHCAAYWMAKDINGKDINKKLKTLENDLDVAQKRFLNEASTW